MSRDDLSPKATHLRFEDLEALASADDRHVVPLGVREDGSVLLGHRTLGGRCVTWIASHLLGRPDQPSVQLNLLLARQLMAVRGGVQAVAASDRIGLAGMPLRNRDIQSVIHLLGRIDPRSVDSSPSAGPGGGDRGATVQGVK